MNDKLDFNQAHPLKACRVEPVGEHPESRGPAQPIGGYVTFGNVWHVRKKFGRFWLCETRRGKL